MIRRCLRCGKPFKVRIDRLETAKFCSHDCYLLYKKEMWSKTSQILIISKKQHASTIRNDACYKKKRLQSQLRSRMHNPQRDNNKYREWRDSVFRRDHWTCRQCGYKGHDIVAHHIYSFHEHPELRYDVDNGLTLCRSCHRKLHYNVGEETRFQKGQYPWNKLPIPPKEELEKLYWKDGLSTVIIAKIFGVCHKTVRKWLKHYNIPIRSLSEAQRNWLTKIKLIQKVNSNIPNIIKIN